MGKEIEMEHKSRLTEADVMLTSTPKYPYTTEKRADDNKGKRNQNLETC